MIRKFNYTGRKKIPRSNLKVYFDDISKLPYTFNAELNLESLRLPGNAEVWVEAYDTSSYMRFSFGNVGSIRIPPSEKRRLTDIHSTDAVRFRIKVIDNTGKHGRILALANGIATTGTQPQTSHKIPLLPVIYKDLEQEIWRLEYTSEGPFLVINNQLIDYGIREHVRTDNSFISLVYPSVIREILLRIFLSDEVFDTEGDDWQNDWLKFITGIPGGDDLPEPEEDNLGKIQNMIDFLEWIDNEAVPAFCKKNAFKEKYQQEFLEETQE
jgi:hypothetical protein